MLVLGATAGIVNDTTMFAQLLDGFYVGAATLAALLTWIS